MSKNLAKYAMVLLALLDLAVGAGFFLKLPWATALWPFTTQPLDYVVISSFLIAGTGAVLWIGLTGEWGALVGALLDVGLFNAGAAGWLAYEWMQTGDVAYLYRAIAFAIFLGGEIGMMAAVWRRPVRDRRPVDRLLTISFWIFALVLLVASIQLLLHLPIWPWPLEAESSTLFGLLFLGSAVYFFYGLYKPSWHKMKGQLVAFLLYDLVLVQPYLHMGDGDLGYHLNYSSLAIYWAVILYSGGLSTYYLFFCPRTKTWAIEETGA